MDNIKVYFCISWENKYILQNRTEAFTGSIQTSYESAKSRISDGNNSVNGRKTSGRGSIETIAESSPEARKSLNV